MKKIISFSNFNKEATETKEGGLWDNIHKRRKKGLPPKKPGQKGYPKTLDIESKEAYEPITTKRSQALAKADAEPKKPVTLPKAPWDKGTKANTKGTNVTYDKNGNVVKEGLDEISIDMQNRYMKKASAQYKKANDKKELGAFGSATQKGADANQKKYDKRHKGIGSVIKRKASGGISTKTDRAIASDPKRNSMTGKPAPYSEGAMKRMSTGDGMDTFKKKPTETDLEKTRRMAKQNMKSVGSKSSKKPDDEMREVFSSRAIVKKDRQGSGKPMTGGSDAHKAAVKKYISGMKSNRPGNTLPRQMKDPKKDAMVSKDGKVKVVDKDLEKAHLARGYVRAEHMISKELYMREAKTIMVTHPKTPNRSMEITVDQWPSFKMRGYHHAEQKENTNSMRLINKMKKASPAAKKALEAPSRVDNKDNKDIDKINKALMNKRNNPDEKDKDVIAINKKLKVTELTIADVRKAAEKAKKRQEKERQATGKTSTSTDDLAARNEAKKPSADYLAKIGVTPVSQMTPAQKKADAERRKEYIAFQKSKRNESVQEAEECECTICECNPCTCGPTGGMPTGDAEGLGEALDMKQRLARGRSARKNKAKMAMGRRRAGRRIASIKVLRKRAMRAARKTLTKRLTKGIAKTDLSVSRKREIEKRLDKPAFKIKAQRLVKRTIKDIRKKEIARKRK